MSAIHIDDLVDYTPFEYEIALPVDSVVSHAEEKKKITREGYEFLLLCPISTIIFTIIF